MSVPSTIHTIRLVKMQPEEKLASEPIEYVVEDKFYRVDFYKTLLEESNKLSEGTPVMLGIEEGARGYTQEDRG